MPPAHRADHIGSLLRPTALLEAQGQKHLSDTYTHHSDPSIIAIENNAIKAALREQIDRGIRPLTNGEYPRPIFYSGLFENLSGMTPQPTLPIPDAFRTDFPTTTGLAKHYGHTTRAAVVATGKIESNPACPPYLAEWTQLHSCLKDLNQEDLLPHCKITIPAPSWQHIQLKPNTAWSSSSPYTSDESYFRALATAYTSTLTTLYTSGCRNIQFDDPHLTYFCDESFLAGCRADDVDPDDLLDLYIQVYSWILAPLECPGLRIGMHLCRGNMTSSTHWASGSYETIARKLFNDVLGIDTFYLEFDDEARSGGFDPLRFLPRGRGKTVVLGLVSTKVAALEGRNELVGRVRIAAEVISEAWGCSVEEVLQEALALSPQCGFSSHAARGGEGGDVGEAVGEVGGL